MRIPSDNEFIRLLMLEINNYCNEHIFPIVTEGRATVKSNISESKEFNAYVFTSDCRQYYININIGTVEKIINIINALDNEDINEEIDAISNVLLGDNANRDDIYQSLAFGAIIFIIFHEFAHIFRGHLEYSFKNRTINTESQFLYFDEIVSTLPSTKKSLGNSFNKLIELDADSSALTLFFQTSLELFATSSDYFSEARPEWLNMYDNSVWRNATNKLAFYSTALVFSLVDVERGQNNSYPMLFTRFLNMSSVFRQNQFDYNDVQKKNDKAGSIQYFKLTSEKVKFQDENIYLPFFYGIDFIVEISKFTKTPISSVIDLEREEYEIYRDIYKDFIILSQSVDNIDELTMLESKEFQQLRMMLSEFYEVFNKFVIY